MQMDHRAARDTVQFKNGPFSLSLCPTETFEKGFVKVCYPLSS
jgi:hypothetical protein